MFKSLILDFISLFYPELCVVCEVPLVREEKYLCLRCRSRLPVTNYHLAPDNPACERFKGKVPYVKVAACIFYNKSGMGQRVVSEIKYRGNRSFGLWMGAYMAQYILDADFLRDIDCLVPVPLHPEKLKKRKFNQAEALASGISRITGIPVRADCLYRNIANPTQTKKGSYERWLNTVDIFAVHETETLAGKHILLIDDVLTTGSTLEACAHPLLACENLKISILTLSITQ